MKLIVLAPLVALALAGSSAGAYFWLSSEGRTEEAAIAQATPIPTPAPAEATPAPTPAVTAQLTPTPIPTPTEPAAKGGQAQALQTYRNENGYEVALPPGYRVASFFMERFAERISYPGVTVAPEDYVVLAPLNEQEEQEATQQASEEIAIGLAPWYGFDKGRSIHIFPLEIIYPGVSVDDFLRNVNMAGIIRENSEIKQVTLASGQLATRLTRRDVDDNGDFTYDVVLASFGPSDSNTVVFRIVKTPDYDREAFETIFRSLTNE